MEGTSSENVLTEIEENLQDIVEKDDVERSDDAESLEEFDVVDSWEVGGADDVHSVDKPSRRSRRRSRGSSYTRRKNDKSSRNNSSHDSYRSRKSSHKRPHSRSKSKPVEHRRPPKRVDDVKNNDRHSVEHLIEPIPGSQNFEKLPDLKCTTSVETGEVNVVLLTEDKIALDHFDEKEPLEDKNSPKKHPLLLKNPFAFARLRRKHSQSPDKSRVKGTMLRMAKYRRVIDDKNNERSLSPYRPRSKHRASPSFCDKKSTRKSVSISPERYASRRTRDGGRWYVCRSPEGSGLSRVSSKSSLSFISSDEMSPRDHDRKRSPLWPKGYVHRPKSKSHGQNLNSDNFVSNVEDFDHKLSLLLKEGKQKQSFSNDSSACTPPEYHSSTTWRPAEWTNVNTTPVSNYPCDTTVKPEYNTNVQGNAYSGFTQDQYNQETYYNNSQPTNYLSNYTGDTANAVQPPYNYGNQYPNQIPNQYYPQISTTAATVPTLYTNPPDIAQFPPMDQLQSHPVSEVIVQPVVNTTHQSYPIGGDQMNYVSVESPLISVQESRQSEAPKVLLGNDVRAWSKYDRKRVPTRTNIPLTSEENVAKEEDPMRTPPPPVIADTWREIESGGKKLSSLLEEANKKREVIVRCEDMLQKMLMNDPVMVRLKIQFENMQQFSVIEEPKQAPELKSKSAMRAARRAAKMKRFQSPLLRKRTNPCLQYVPWLPGDEDLSKAVEVESCEHSVHSTVQLPKSILKNSAPGKEEVCATCCAKRDSMVSASTQTEELVTNEVAVQVEGDWNHYYPDSNYKNSNSSYSDWYR